MVIANGLEYERDGDWAQAAALYGKALAEVDDPVEQATLLIRIGACLAADHEFDEALERLEEAHKIAVAEGDRRLQADTLVIEGEIAERRCNLKTALRKYQRAAEGYAEAGVDRPDLTVRLASTERRRGELKAALERLDGLDAVDLSDALRAAYLDERGAIEIARGDFESAVSTLTQALEIDLSGVSTEYQAGGSRLLLAEAYLYRGDRRQAKKLIEQALEAYEREDTGLSEAYALYGQYYEEAGDFLAAVRWYKRGLNLDRAGHDPGGEARALRRLGCTYRKKGEPDRAREFYEDARQALEGSDDDVEKAALCTEEGHLALYEGDFDKAVEKFERALRIAQTDGNEHSVAVAMRNLALALKERNELEDAEEILRKAMGPLEERGDLRQLNELLDDLGEVLLDRDRYRDAIEVLERSLELDEQMGSVTSKARSLLLLGRAHLQLGQRKDAGDCLRRALDTYRSSEDEVGKSNALFQLGSWYAEEGNLAEAKRHIRESYNLEARQEDAIGMARALRGLAMVARMSGDLSRAEEHLEEAKKELAGTDDATERAFLSLEEAKLDIDRGAYDHAEAALRAAMRVFESKSPAQRATCQRHLARVHAGRRDFRQALKLLREAEDIFESHGDSPELDELYDDLGGVYLEMNRLPEARAAVQRSLSMGHQVGWNYGKGQSRLLLGEIEMRAGNMAQSRSHLEDAIREFEQVGDTSGQAQGLLQLGDWFCASGRLEEAVSAYKDARRLQHAAHNVRGLARSYARIGHIYLQQGWLDRAEEALEQAQDYFADGDDQREQAPLLLDLGVICASRNDHAGAVRLYRKALELFRDQQQNHLVLETYQRLATSHQALREFEDALDCIREMGFEQASIWHSLLFSLDEEIRNACEGSYRAGSYDDAVIAAFRVLEKRVFARHSAWRSEGNGDARIPISRALEEWVHPDRRGVAPFRDAAMLQQFQRFCVAAFNVIRNPLAHGATEFNSVDAFAAICVAHVISKFLEPPDESAMGVDVAEVVV